MKQFLIAVLVLSILAGRTLAQSACTNQAVLDLTPNQIAHLSSAPLEVIPAPGLGRMLLFLGFAVQVKTGTIPFNASSAQIYYTLDTLSSSVLEDIEIHFDDFRVDGLFFAPQTSLNLGAVRSIAENSGITLIAPVDSLSGGLNAVTCPAVGGGGTGYAINDTFDVSSGSLGTGIVDNVSGGVVTACHITTPGYAYSAPSLGVGTTHTSGSGDDALTLDITTITPANSTARVWINYQVLTLP